jgi:transcriptional regulator with XRE-family HTH domain
MGMVCSICSHSERLRIDRELVQGKTKSEIARQFGVGNDALAQHERKHLSRQLVQAFEKKQEMESFNLLERIERILGRAERIFRRNYSKNTATGDSLALKSISEQRQTFELLAKIAAHLHQVRAMELQMSQTTTDNSLKERAEAFAEKAASRLNEKEQDMLESLLSKIEGATKEVIIPAETEQWPSRSSKKLEENTPPPTPPPTTEPEEARPLRRRPIPRVSKSVRPYSIKPRFK